MPTCTLFPLPYRRDASPYFLCLEQAPGLVWLDSGKPGSERGRFDILSAWPLAQLAPEVDETGAHFLARARELLAARLEPAEPPDGLPLPFCGGLLGYLSYDFGKRLERLPAQARDDLQLPDASIGLYDWALINDHQQQQSVLLFHPSVTPERQRQLQQVFSTRAPMPGRFQLLEPFRAQLNEAQYQQAIRRVQDYIQAGDCYQVNYTQRFQAPCLGDARSAYLSLRQACPTPYSGYLQLEQGAILSLSPERFVGVSQRQVETRPIKGTRPRHPEPEEDARQARALLDSPKDRSENLMIVDLLRNDLGRSSRIGSVRVPELFALESYPNVHHLVSCVRAELADGLDALDLLEGCFPGGSITGAPKIRAMQIIDELEPSVRSVYCGSLFYLDVRGEMDSSITIRTLLVKDGTISCWGGGGIVADSRWQEEYQESITKVRILLDTLQAQHA